MNPQSRISHFIFALILCAGAFLSLIRSNPQLFQSKDGQNLFGQWNENSVPQSVGNWVSRSPRALRARARLEVKQEVEPVISEAPVKPETTVGTLADPKLVAVDPKIAALAKDKKNEKKKKTAKKKTEPVNSMQAQKPSENSEEKKSRSSEYGANSIGGTTTVVTNLGNSAAPRPVSLQDWLTYILREPNYDKTVELVQKFQSGEIASSVFHEVVKNMLIDTRRDMVDLAIFALGATPSAQSFDQLEAYALTQPTSSPLRLRAKAYLNNYSELENLKYLVSVATGTFSADTRAEAIRLLRVSAEEHLRPQVKGGTVVGTSVGGSPSKAAIKKYHPLVPILSRLIQTTGDDSIRDEAATTLQRLQVLLSA